VNFDLSDDQRTIKATARELLAARFSWDEVRRLAFEDERGFTDAQWSEVVELGWPGIAVPEDQAGQGLGTVELAVLAEEVGYAVAPTPLVSTWMCAQLLAAGGEAARLLDGGRRGAVDRWDGAAVPDAGSADVLVSADRVTEEFTAERVESLDPTRPRFTVEAAGGEPLSGDLERAWRQVQVVNAAESVGVAERAMDMAVAYAKERRQFGRPIGTYQAVSHPCAQMLLEVEGARSVVYWAAWALDHSPEEAPLAVACAAAYALDAGRRVPRAALQVLGGIGFTWEHELQFLLKRGEANAHAWGSAVEARERVAALQLPA